MLLLGVAALVLRTGTRAWPLALVAGMGFGGSALAIRAAHVQTGADLDLMALLGQPSTYLVIGYWTVGIVSYTTALSRGDIGAVTAVYLVTQVLVPGMVGIVLLGDPVRAGLGVGAGARAGRGGGRHRGAGQGPAAAPAAGALNPFTFLQAVGHFGGTGCVPCRPGTTS